MEQSATDATTPVPEHGAPRIERLGTLDELTRGIWGGIADVRQLAAS